MGTIDIEFVSDQNKPMCFTLHRVLHVPGLNKRLLSIDAFTHQSPDFRVEFSPEATKFTFNQLITLSLKSKTNDSFSPASYSANHKSKPNKSKSDPKL